MNRSWMWKQRSYREQFEGPDGGGGAGGSATADDQGPNDQQQVEDNQPHDDQQGSDPAAQQADDADEVVISFGDEPDPVSEDEIEGKPAPEWVKNLRKEARESKKRIRELEQAAAAREAAAAPKEDPVGEMPTLEDCDYDAEKYADAKLAWTKRKEAAEAKAAAARQEEEAANTAWNNKVAAYKTAGATLKAAGFEDAEAVVMSTLSATQQGILLEGPKTAEASAQLVAALGRSPAKLAELAAIKNPVKYAFAVAELVSQLKVQSKKVPPAPETQVRSTTGKVTAIDSTEARLEAEADKSGDRSKLIKYRLEKKRKQAA